MIRISFCSMILIGLISVSLTAMGCTASAAKPDSNEVNSESISQTPYHVTKVQVHESAQKRFFQALTDFADRYGFAIRIAPVSRDGLTFSVSLWATDVKIFAGNPFAPSEYRVGFYNYGHPLPEPYLTGLVTDLEAALRSVDNVSVLD